MRNFFYTIFGIIILAGFLFNAIEALWNWSWLFTISIAIGIISLVYWGTKLHKEETLRHKAAISELIDAHLHALYIKKMQSITTDAYGNVLTEKWEKEKLYFYNTVIRPMMSQKFSAKAPEDDLAFCSSGHLIDEAVKQYAETSPLRDVNVDSFSPYEFEAYCAQVLSEAGWSARVTKGSGDQGVDVIASKNGLKAVFQVKLYSFPIGNKAVQEVIAGRTFESADLAYVVSNASYTPSARELAQRASVRLLHYSELVDLEPTF